LWGFGWAGSVAKLEGEAAVGFFDLLKLLAGGLIEMGKLIITG